MDRRTDVQLMTMMDTFNIMKVTCEGRKWEILC